MKKSNYDRELANKIAISLFSFMGVVNLWLWFVGHANFVAAIGGAAFLCGAAYFTWHLYRKRHNK